MPLEQHLGSKSGRLCGSRVQLQKLSASEAFSLHHPTSSCCSLTVQGFKEDQTGVERYLNLRYDGTDVAVMTQCPNNGNYAEVRHVYGMVA